MTEKDIPVEQFSMADDQEEPSKPLQPPAYESLYHTNTAPAYQGLDTELPNYCEVVTSVIITQPRRCAEPSCESERRNISGIEILPYIVIIGCAVISVVLCFPIGVCALGYSIAALQHKRMYKERSTHMRTAIGCVLLATAVGVPIHIVFWRHIAA